MSKIIYVNWKPKKKVKKQPENTVRQSAEYHRKKLIKERTEEENLYGKYLYKNKFKFKFQHIIYTTDPEHPYYIVDFYLPVLNLIVEIDGGYHNNPDQIQKDKHRSFVLRMMGYHLIRITNDEVNKKYN